MDARKVVLRETGKVAIGEGIGVGLMYGAFALLGAFDGSVLLGGIAGAVLAIFNFFMMAVNVSSAADKAVQEDVKGGKALVRFSYITRLVVIFAVLFVLVKSGVCNVFASVIPLLFVRPTLTLAEFFRKPEENKA